MKTLILLIAVLLLASCPATYAGAFIAGALGDHDETRDCPEFCVNDRTLGRVRAGYEFDNGIVLEIMHISGVHVKEQGKGFNARFIEYKYNF